MKKTENFSKIILISFSKIILISMIILISILIIYRDLTTKGWVSILPTGSICSMGAGNRVGNHIEELKRPYGLGSGFILTFMNKAVEDKL